MPLLYTVQIKYHAIEFDGNNIEDIKKFIGSELTNEIHVLPDGSLIFDVNKKSILLKEGECLVKSDFHNFFVTTKDFLDKTYGKGVEV